MKNDMNHFLVILFIFIVLEACSTVPLTGRRQLDLVPSSTMLSMSFQQYDQFLKVVVYTGILPITKDENGLAVVMGHEIAHAVAKHGSERMSQGLITELGGVAMAVAWRDKPRQTQQLFMTAFGVGAQAGVLLPFSRLHESEADHLGLIFMAMAGYDPNGAVTFWERMAQQGGAKPPEFLSTHPSDKTRINKIRAELPEALKYYQKP